MPGRAAVAAIVAIVGLDVGSQAHAQAQAAASETQASKFKAPRVALDRGATACVGLLQDALRLTVEPDHDELSSWNPKDTDKRTFWSATVDRAGERGAFVGVTPSEGSHCDAQTMRVSYLKQDCKTAVAAVGKTGTAALSMGSATVVQRDAAGRLAMYLPGGTGCVLVEMAVLYGR
jgi:hypothetical protein